MSLCVFEGKKNVGGTGLSGTASPSIEILIKEDPQIEHTTLQNLDK